MERFAIAFDNHGEQADPAAIKSFFDFVAWWKPTIRIHGGDLVDATALRRGASEDERRAGWQADVDAGIAFLQRFRPQIWLLGNHEHRLQRTIATCGDGGRREFASILFSNLVECVPGLRIIEYGKRVGHVQLGDFRVIHGYHSGLYAARMASASYGNVIMGHVHTPTYYESPHIDGATGYTSGCLCRLDMDYNLGQANALRQAHGWVYGIVHRGRACVFTARKCGKTWILPSEFREQP